MTGIIESDMKTLDRILAVDDNFDIIKRDIRIGGRSAAVYFIDGYCKEAVAQKLLEFLIKLTPQEIKQARTPEDFLSMYMPYTEVTAIADAEPAVTQVLSGQMLILIDGYCSAFAVDTREYPTRGITEPEKDRSLRGARDSFCETLVSNTALIRRRIRDPKLRMEYVQIGGKTKLDLCICYIEGEASEKALSGLRRRLKEVRVNAISMTSEALAEALVPASFFNPLPRIKYTERPDYASACVMEGRIALVMDNSPSVMIFATDFTDFMRDADDYYFPPLTASYVRFSRLIVSVLTVFLTPTVLLFNLNQQWIPGWLEFIKPAKEVTMPLIAQFLILEFVIDGLRLASINTPTTMSNSLGIIGGLLLSDFAVAAGWFAPDTIVYISFVAIASYAQPSLEMGYAMKFARVLLLFLVQFFSLWGLIGGTALFILMLICTRTLGGFGYFKPFVPFSIKGIAKLCIRTRLKNGGDE